MAQEPAGYKQKTVRGGTSKRLFPMRIPLEIWEWADREATEQDVSLAQFICQILREKMETHK